MNIAFIGTGVMGSSMALHLHNKGHQVYVYNRHMEKAEKLRDKGLIPCDSIEKCVQNKDVVLTMVGYPQDVEEIYFNERGILDSAKAGCILIDMTTSSPSLSKKIYEKAKSKNLSALDAPVSGGDIGAKNGTLTTMVGGDEKAFEQVKELLLAFSKSVHYMGKAGNGQHTKACNQLCVLGATAAYTEALVYAQNVGLDSEKMIEAIKGGAAYSWQLEHMAPRVLKNDFAPGFFVKHFIKDMMIAKNEAEKKGISLPVLNTVLKEYEQLSEKGMENEGTQALIKLFLTEK